MPERQADPYGRGSYCIVVAMHGDRSREAEVLRDFRDNYLQRVPGGKKLIELYYNVSPRLVPVFRKNRYLDLMVSKSLATFTKLLSGVGL